MERVLGSFSFPTISFPQLGSILSGIFFVVIVLLIVFSAVLLYHWIRYGKHIMNTGLVVTVYFVGIALFLSMMALGV